MGLGLLGFIYSGFGVLFWDLCEGYYSGLVMNIAGMAFSNGVLFWDLCEGYKFTKMSFFQGWPSQWLFTIWENLSQHRR